jgi:hypothetical protein
MDSLLEVGFFDFIGDPPVGGKREDKGPTGGWTSTFNLLISLGSVPTLLSFRYV